VKPGFKALDDGLKGGEGAEGGERPAAALLLGNRGEVGAAGGGTRCRQVGPTCR
jgi:hypothetical protein